MCTLCVCLRCTSVTRMEKSIGETTKSVTSDRGETSTRVLLREVEQQGVDEKSFVRL